MVLWHYLSKFAKIFYQKMKILMIVKQSLPVKLFKVLVPGLQKIEISRKS